jgi:peptidoglycan LD-endopeptidase CwlK
MDKLFDCSLRETMNTSSQTRLQKVHPELGKRVTELIQALQAQAMQVEVVQGLRTFEEQDELYAQGRSKPGQIVTRAKGGQSNHNYGLAVDLCPFVNGQPQWNDNHAFFRIGKEAESRGLEWGGDWQKFIDKPHVQLPGLTVNQCFALFKQGGLDNVWKNVPGLA